jgi:TrmH family RNA methyltransferase
MPTNAEIKRVKALHQKKYRQQHGLFIAEGPNLVEALLQSHHSLDRLYATEEGLQSLNTAFDSSKLSLVKPATLAAMSALDSAHGMLATVQLPTHQPELVQEPWLIAIDGIQNPGNLGTIIRTADWFGFPNLVCSPNTVDAYNPKVVQGSMGSIFHTRLFYRFLPAIAAKREAPLYTLEKTGTDLYSTNLPNAGMLVVGHETQGISEAMRAEATQPLRIPGYGKAESLNAAVATAVTLAQLRTNLEQNR